MWPIVPPRWMNLCSRIRLAVPITCSPSTATTVRTPAAFRPRQMWMASSGVRFTGTRFSRVSRNPRVKSPCCRDRSTNDTASLPGSGGGHMVPHAGRPDDSAFPDPPVPLDGPGGPGYREGLDQARRAEPMATTAQPVYPWQAVPAPHVAPEPEPDPDPTEAEQLARRDIWRVGPSSKPAGRDLEPLSREWYEYLDSKRYRRHGRWVPPMLEFT